jgi:hypothetical protein
MVLPYRLQSLKATHFRTAIDEKLMEKTRLDEFTLRRIRKAFALRFARLSYVERRALSEGGTCVRFGFMYRLLRTEFLPEHWEAWVRYLEHSDRDFDDMVHGEYPISPYIIRVHSALFGIKVDFLMQGAAPAADKTGANIDIWPLTGTR